LSLIILLWGCAKTLAANKIITKKIIEDVIAFFIFSSFDENFFDFSTFSVSYQLDNTIAQIIP